MSSSLSNRLLASASRAPPRAQVPVLLRCRARALSGTSYARAAAQPSAEPKYTKPELRKEVKEEIKEGDKGGKPGTWSARKAQMTTLEYMKRGGGFSTPKSEQDPSQERLSKWSEEEWQTKEGEGKARQEDGSTKRYLPKKAWEEMSEGEKEATDQKKVGGSRKGRQVVGNTEGAREERKKVSEEGKGGASHEKEAEGVKHTEKAKQAGKKKYAENTGQTENKKQVEKTRQADQTKDTDYAKQDADAKNQSSGPRVPRKGQKVSSKVGQNQVEVEVVEVVWEKKVVEGKSANGSKDDPRIVLRGVPSGKMMVRGLDSISF